MRIHNKGTHAIDLVVGLELDVFVAGVIHQYRSEDLIFISVEGDVKAMFRLLVETLADPRSAKFVFRNPTS